MPYVSGFLRVTERGSPDNSLPGGGNVDNSLPGGGSIDNSLPEGTPPIGSTLPEPPPGVWPPPSFSRPIVPTNPIAPPPPGSIYPPPPGVDNTLPTPPVDGTTPPPSTKPPSETFWVVAGIPGLGWRYVCVDPSLKPGTPLPPTPEPK